MNLPWRNRSLPVPGPAIMTSLTAPEAAELARLAEGRTVLEVGSAYGFSTVVMALAATRVTSVDHHAHLFNGLVTFRRNLDAYGVSGRVDVLVGDARDVLPALPDASFDAAFVDGDHSAAGVTFDALRCLRLVRPGGVIAFHDHGEASCPEVGPALDALFPGGGRKVDTLFLVTVPRPEADPCSPT